MVPRRPVLAVLVALAACVGEEPLRPVPAGAVVAIQSGDGQTVGAGASASLAVLVTDSTGAPLASVAVAWTVAVGGGSVPATTVTSGNGVATAQYDVGGTTGTKQVVATVDGAAGSPLTFTVSVVPGAANRLVRTAGDGQSAIAGDALPAKLAVTAVDAFGNAVSGVAVTWTVASGSASVAPDAPATDAQGVARATVTTQQPPGPITVRAAAPGLSGSPLSFTATATVPIVLVKELPVAPNYGLHDTFVRDGLAFLSAWNTGLLIYDVGNGVNGGSPAAPQLVGSVVTEANGVAGGAQVHNAWWFHAPGGDRRYVFVGQEGSGVLGSTSSGDIHVVDISILGQPLEVGSFHLSGAGVHNFWMDEQRQVLFAAYYNAGVVALDVAGGLGGDIANRELHRLQVGGAGNTFTWGVMLYGGSLYASDMVSGLWQVRFDSTTRRLSVAGGGNNVPDRYTSDLWVANGYAYTGTWGNRFVTGGSNRGNAVKVWQLDAGGAPVLVDSIVTADVGTVSDIEVSADGALLLFSTENGPNAGVWLYDLTASRSRPALVGYYRVSTGVHTATFAEIGGRRYVFAAKDPASPSLLILDVTALGP